MDWNLYERPFSVEEIQELDPSQSIILEMTRKDEFYFYMLSFKICTVCAFYLRIQMILSRSRNCTPFTRITRVLRA